ncbi:TlpA family protein disulfide reductase [Marinoscillum sp.]|uniref:TlpA family protein disulfide reductase n=1 Tax=Marinoscillum sp. TaxID=2024838 RepID=UPI003BAB0BB2
MKISKFHRYVLWLFLLIAVLACESPAPISGHLEAKHPNDKVVYLIQPTTLQEVGAAYFGEVIDSAQVQPDGTFAFTNPPTFQKPTLLEVVLGQSGKSAKFLETTDPSRSNFMPIVLQSGEKITIQTREETFQKSFTIKNPSFVNQELLKLRNVHQEAYQNHLLGKQWQPGDGSQLLEKEHAVRDYQKELMAFADRTTELILALVAMRLVSPEGNYERVPEFLVKLCNTWHEQQPNHPWVKQLCALANPEELPVLIGDQFPNLKLPMLASDTAMLHDLLGERLTIVDLWASWCAPCRKENREVLVPLWENYHEEGLQIVAYGLESDVEVWKKAVLRDGADRWQHGSDLQGDDALFLRQIRVQTIPANFIVDREGLVVAKNLHGEELMEWVMEYFANF